MTNVEILWTRNTKLWTVFLTKIKWKNNATEKFVKSVKITFTAQESNYMTILCTSFAQ